MQPLPLLTRGKPLPPNITWITITDINTGKITYWSGLSTNHELSISIDVVNKAIEKIVGLDYDDTRNMVLCVITDLVNEAVPLDIDNSGIIEQIMDTIIL